MYFPYLRGRQYELLALRELIENDRLSDNIIPIIEPVKITSTLLSTIKTFINNNNKMIIIRNPKVGNFIADSHNSKIKVYLKVYNKSSVTAIYILV